MSNRTIVVFAPHPDDEVLGAGGTIIKMAERGANVIVCIATKGHIFDVRRKEAIEAHKYMGVRESVFLDFPDLGLDSVPKDKLTDAIREVIKTYRPDDVYTSHIGDLHTDHKALTEAILVSTRPKYDYSPECVYTYETLSETGLNYQDPLNCFDPNVYVDIGSTLERKIKALEKHESQIEIYPCGRSRKAIATLAAYRGAQSGMEAAEAFTLIRRYAK